MLAGVDGTPYRARRPELVNALGERTSSTPIDDMPTTLEGRPLTLGTAPVIVDTAGRPLSTPSLLDRVADALPGHHGGDPVVVDQDGHDAAGARPVVLGSDGRPVHTRPGSVLLPQAVAGVDPEVSRADAAAVRAASTESGIPSLDQLRTTLPAELDTSAPERAAVESTLGTAAARRAGEDVLNRPGLLDGATFRWSPGQAGAGSSPLVSGSTTGAMVGEGFKQVLRAAATMVGLPSHAVDAASAAVSACVGAICGSAGKVAEGAVRGKPPTERALRTAGTADTAALLARAAASDLPAGELARLATATGGGYVARSLLTIPASSAPVTGHVATASGLVAPAADLLIAPYYLGQVRPLLAARGLVGTPENPARTVPQVVSQVLLDTAGTVPGQVVALGAGDAGALPGVLDAPRQSFFTTVPGQDYRSWYTGPPTSRADAYGRLMQQPLNGMLDGSVALLMAAPSLVQQVAGGLGAASTALDDGHTSSGEIDRLFTEGSRTDMADEELRRATEAGAAAQRYREDLTALVTGPPDRSAPARTGFVPRIGFPDCGPGVSSPCIVSGRDRTRAGVLLVGAGQVGDPSRNPRDPRYGHGPAGIGYVGDPSKAPSDPRYGHGSAGIGHVGTGIEGDGSDRQFEVDFPAVATNQSAGHPDNNGMDMWSAGDARSMGVATPGSRPAYHRASGGGR